VGSAKTTKKKIEHMKTARCCSCGILFVRSACQVTIEIATGIVNAIGIGKAGVGVAKAAIGIVIGIDIRLETGIVNVNVIAIATGTVTMVGTAIGTVTAIVIVIASVSVRETNVSENSCYYFFCFVLWSDYS
jgi:hypothetical protein